MTTFKLTYFDLAGIRGEAVRLVLTLGNIPFEDERITWDHWPHIKAQLLRRQQTYRCRYTCV